MTAFSHTPGDTRLQALQLWLQALANQFSLSLDTLAPASADASFRRYFRLRGNSGTVIVMDAPPPHEDCRPFIHVTDLLAKTGVNVPTLLAHDVDQGFLLLSDLGPQTYYQAIQSGIDDVSLQTRYREALAALVNMQHADHSSLPAYNAGRLMTELQVFPEWFIDVHCKATLTDKESEMLKRVFNLLVEDNCRQGTVLVHRDFHSPNLMLCTAPAYGPNPGVIDYQDALAGPITYDIASLVMDARTTWEEPQQLDWAIRYWELARKAGLPIAPDFADFHRAYEWMSLQRNLRIMGVFARLSHRDGKHHYLDHMPRVSGYIRQVASRYGVFVPLLRLLDRLENRQVIEGYTF